MTVVVCYFELQKFHYHQNVSGGKTGNVTNGQSEGELGNDAESVDQKTESNLKKET